MSNIIPPLLSNTPPPPPSPEEEDDDEFGDFTGANDFSYGCDNLSLPPSPDHSPKNMSILNGLDINSNAEKNEVAQTDGIEKDFQDKRKPVENFSEWNDITENGCIEDIHKNESFFDHSVEDNIHILPENEAEEYSKAIVNDEKAKIKFSEKGNEVEEDINNFYRNNQKANLQEILTKNLENETSFVVDSNNEDFPVNENISIDSNGETSIKGETSLTSENLGGKIVENGEISIDYDGDCGKYKDDNLENIEGSNESVSEFTLDNCVKSDDIDELNTNKHDISPAESICSLKGHQQIGNNNQKDTTTFNSSRKNETVSSEAFMENDISDSCENESTGDFGEFTSGNVAESNKNSSENESEAVKELGNFPAADNVEKNDLSVVSDDSFGDFSSHRVIPKTALNENAVKPAKDNDDFDDDFGEFASTTFTAGNLEPKDVPSSSTQNDNEFGNFANFSEVMQEPVFLMLDEKQALEKAEIILKEIFPHESNDPEDFQYVEVEKGDFIFNELKDITETTALTYQWSKSASQNVLLKALSIDARNILYGPSWNPSMPRFAANLGLQPLEPVKTEILTPSAPTSSPSISVQSTNVEVPSAQFDWSGSGLVNPLDYSQTMLLDLEQLVASLEIPTCNASSNLNNFSSPTPELDDWNIWLQSVSKEPLESSSSIETTQKPLELSIEPSLILQPKPTSLQGFTKPPSKTDLEQKIQTSEDQFDDFDDFASYQPPQESHAAANWPSVPLRETYISSDNMPASSSSKDITLDIEGWLQPTIVTPELPRRDLSLGDEELPDIPTPELSRKDMSIGNFDDDFEDFQMVLPEVKNTNTNSSIPIDILQPIKSENKDPVISQSNLNPLKKVEFPDFSFFEEKSKLDASIQEKQNKNSLEIEVVEEKVQEPADEEDEFTDFHSSAPISQPVAPKPLTPILEPLKPVLVYPTVSTAPTQINWPDPGITEDEIKKFEMVFSQPQKSKCDEPKKEEAVKEKQPTNTSSVDEDEWSDFVSVQKPSPVHKFQLNEKERTSSPDLTLSVLNLGSIQPTKQPIPVITPQGLMQTKLSSNVINMSPKSQPKLVTQSKPAYQQPQNQPSIISNQFASQAYNFNSYTSQSQAGSNRHITPDIVNQKSLDDDDWSDFVSSPLPPSTANGYQQNWQNVPSQQPLGWNNASPNIIMNPGHFVQSGSDVKSKKVSNFSVTSKKSTIPSISIPDLEFIAPKGRTSSSRKK